MCLLAYLSVVSAGGYGRSCDGAGSGLHPIVVLQQAGLENQLVVLVDLVGLAV